MFIWYEVLFNYQFHFWKRLWTRRWLLGDWRWTDDFLLRTGTPFIFGKIEGGRKLVSGFVVIHLTKFFFLIYGLVLSSCSVQLAICFIKQMSRWTQSLSLKSNKTKQVLNELKLSIFNMDQRLLSSSQGLERLHVFGPFPPRSRWTLSLMIDIN